MLDRAIVIQSLRDQSSLGGTQLPWLRWLGILSACLALSFTSRQASPLQAPSGQSAGPQSDPLPQLRRRTPEERERINQATHRIFLNVYVSDASGKSPTDLKQTDFTLIEDHQLRKVEGFRSVQGSSAIAPAHIILVLDAVNNPSRKLGYFRREIEKYLRQGDGPLAYPMSIALSSNSGVSVGLPSRDRSALLQELKALTDNLHTIGCAEAAEDERYLPGHNGLSPLDPNPRLDCLNHHFNTSVKALASLAQQQVDVPVRVILVWIGQGWPLLSSNGFVPDTPSVKRSFFHDLVEVSSALMEGQVTLDAIASPSAESRNAHDRAFFDGVPDQSQVTAGSLGLHPLAHQSGGQILTNTKDIAGEIDACLADTKSYYVLSYDSPPATAFGEYHSIQVKVDKPGLTVRTNTLYYAEP